MVSGGGGTTVVRIRVLRGVAVLALASLLASTAARGDEVPSLPDDLATAAPSGTGVAMIDVATSGNIRKELGEPAGLTIDGSDTAYFEVIVEDVSVGTSCPGRGIRVAPLRGYFVVIELSSTMNADVSRLPGVGADVFMPLVAEAFHIIGPEGQEVPPGPTEASWACFENDDLAAPFIGPGESTAGLLVLDSPFESGTLAYEPAGPGWQWEF